jgi:ferredoxin-like protein FixX
MGLWRVPLGKKAKLSPKYKELCLECAACWEICEQEAIDFWYPKGGTGIVIEYG